MRSSLIKQVPETTSYSSALIWQASDASSPSLKDFLGKISVVILVGSEDSRIFEMLEKTTDVLSKTSCPYEIIVVGSGDKDFTCNEVELANRRYGHIKAVKVNSNDNKGYAIRESLKHVDGDLVAFLDASLDMHPQQLENLFLVMVKENADIVIGSRRHPSSEVEYPWHRKLMGNVYYYLVRFLFGLPIRDTQTSIKLFRGDAAKEIYPRLRVERHAFNLELLVVSHYLGMKATEAPIKLKSRCYHGKIKLIDIYHILRDTFEIFYRLHFKYDPVSSTYLGVEPDTE
jgi:glycosyltransferase involved in cell wall biosynthesis